MDLSVFLTADGLISLFTLTMMEIILGIDNIVFISIVAGKLPESQQARARTLGLTMALVFRILLLLSINWIVGLTYTVINPLELLGLELSKHMMESFALSWRDLILIAGGIFLMTNTINEMHHKLEGEDESGEEGIKEGSFWSIVAQIIALDIVFSFDSILTAVGLVDHIEIMIAAVIISLGIMLAASGAISNFINRRPTMKMLALSFLMLIGFMLVAEGFEQHIDKGYIYFAMAFSFIVELLNSRIRKGKNIEPVQLRERFRDDEDEQSS
ncbi:MAG: TerC family protein [Bacteroidia bacterium]|nr:TerC family protein [Bacteroidia bacterium]